MLLLLVLLFLLFGGVGSLLSDGNESLTLSTTVTTLLNTLLKMPLFFLFLKRKKNSQHCRGLIWAFLVASLSGKPLHIITTTLAKIAHEQKGYNFLSFFVLFLVIFESDIVRRDCWRKGVATKWDLKLKISGYYWVLCVCMGICVFFVCNFRLDFLFPYFKDTTSSLFFAVILFFSVLWLVAKGE